MKPLKLFISVGVLPLTLFLDFLLFASGLRCASCGSFWLWLSSESSFSFPIIAGLTTIGIASDRFFTTKGEKKS